MNSLCIKTNNDKTLEYLKNEFSDFNMQNVSFSCNEFKLYKNIIIHYTGIDTELFYTKLASILSYLVIDNFEPEIIKNIFDSNYFYFNKLESEKILNLCDENIYDDKALFQNRELFLFDAFYDYITEHHSIVLTGFINFRLYNYRNLLEELVDLSVNEFIIEREYLEFISLIKLYVSSQECCCNSVHVVFLENETFMLDEEMNIIDINKNAFKAKYLSDVSFSHNDYVLNSLLNLLPSKIYLHVTSNSDNSDFINTLKLIFEERISICTDCNICNLYKSLKINH